MTLRKSDGLAIVREIVDALSAHGDVACCPEISEDVGLFTLSVTFHAGDTRQAMEILELAERLRRVRDVAQVRAFGERYGIDAAALDAVIGGADAPAGSLSREELDALVLLVESDCALTGPLPLHSPLRPILVTGALPKLRAMRGRKED